MPARRRIVRSVVRPRRSRASDRSGPGVRHKSQTPSAWSHGPTIAGGWRESLYHQAAYGATNHSCFLPAYASSIAYQDAARKGGTAYVQTRCWAREHAARRQDADVPGQSIAVRTCALPNRDKLTRASTPGWWPLAAGAFSNRGARFRTQCSSSRNVAEASVFAAKRAYAWLIARSVCCL
jgi:hypothetical protein